MEQAHLSLRTRKPGPTPQQWQDIRPKFEQLYKQTDPVMTLKEIQHRLAAEDDFGYAELHHYKTRIKKWGLRRNVKAEDIDNIVKIHGTELTDLCNAGLKTSDGRFIGHDKLIRHIARREKNRHTVRSNQKDDLVKVRRSAKHTSLRNGKLRSAARTIELPLSITETILNTLKQCHIWESIIRQQGLAPDGSMVPDSCDVGVWTSHMVDGINTLQRGYRRNAWESFNQGCDLFVKCLSSPPEALLIHIIRIFCVSSWKECHDFRTRILSFFRAWVCMKLGNTHVLSSLLDLLLRSTEGLERPAWWRECRRLTNDVNLKHGCYKHLGLLWTAEDQEVEDLEESITRLELLSLEAQAHSGVKSTEAFTVGHRRCRALIELGKYIEARANLLGILDLNESFDITQTVVEDLFLHLEGDSYMVYSVLGYLGVAANKLGRGEEALAWSRAAFRWAVWKGIDDIDIVEAMNDLEWCLIRRELWSELRELRQQYPQFHDVLPDKYRLFDIPDDASEYASENNDDEWESETYGSESGCGYVEEMEEDIDLNIDEHRPKIVLPFGDMQLDPVDGRNDFDAEFEKCELMETVPDDFHIDQHSSAVDYTNIFAPVPSLQIPGPDKRAESAAVFEDTYGPERLSVAGLNIAMMTKADTGVLPGLQTQTLDPWFDPFSQPFPLPTTIYDVHWQQYPAT
jgi:hypothetical protein